MVETARIGILYRGKSHIRSIRIFHPESVGDELAEMDSLGAVEEWMEKSGSERQTDASYLDYFYRCLDEQVEFYYLYEVGVGWKVGCTMRELPVRGKLVGLEEWLQWKAVESV